MPDKSVTRGVLALLVASLFFSCVSSPRETPVYQATPVPAVNADAEHDRTTISVENKPQPPARVLLRSDPPEKPEWVDALPESTTELYFTGTSQPYDTAANARDDARENARNQVLLYYGQIIESKAVSRSSTRGNTQETLVSYIDREDTIQSFAHNIVSEVGAVRYYTETYLNNENKEEYIVYTLCRVSRQKVEEDIASFSKNTSERYVHLFPLAANLKSALEGFAFIYKSLEQNPLHRATAWYDSPNGRVSVYDYAALKINALSNSVNFAAMDSATVQKNNTLNMTVKLTSAEIPFIGPLQCRVSIHGNNNAAPAVHYTVGNDNTFLVSIHTNLLAPGKYNAELVLLMETIAGGIGKNLSGGFSFEVTPDMPPEASVSFSGDIPEARERRTIINGLRSALRSFDIPITIHETAAEKPETAVYNFEITINREQSKVYNNDLIKTEISVDFKHNGIALFNTSPYSVTETTDALSARRITERIKNDEVFLKQVRDVLAKDTLN